MPNVIAFLVFSSLTLSSIYIFPSGLPQPSDVIMSLAFVFTFLQFLQYNRKIQNVKNPRGLLLLTIWITLVSFAWAIFYSSPDFLTEPLYWAYNLFLSFTLLQLLKLNKNGQEIISLSMCAALFISTIGVAIGFEGGSVRNSGFFNNPNQLAYFSLCAPACIMVLQDFRISSRQVIFSFIVGAIGLVSASSIGAIAGGLMLFLSLVFANRQYMKNAILIPVFFITMSSSIILVDTYFDNVISQSLSKRFDRSESKIDGMYTERNYHIIQKFPEHIIFGAGSSMHKERFGAYGNIEIHSSFGYLIFNFGVISLIFLLYFLFEVLRNSNIQSVFVVLAPVIYSFSHMGLRFSIFWILLICVYYKRHPGARRA